MNRHHQIWTGIQELMQAFGPFYQEAIAAVMRDAPRHWNFLRAAAGLEPQPLTLQLAQQFMPYLPAEAVALALSELCDKGMLQADGAGADYYLTGDGYDSVRKFFDAAQTALTGVSPLPEEQTLWLRDTLRHLVRTAGELPQPEQKVGLTASRWSAPDDNGPLAPQIDQYLTDLYYYRDDAHVAAWKPTGLSGPAWEALTFIWREQAHTAEQLAAKLANRTLSEADWTEVLEDLAGRNLIEEAGDVYQLTQKGRELREDAEATTDAYYFAALESMSSKELDQLLSYLQQARDNLKSAALHQFWPLMESVSQAVYPPVKERMTPLLAEQFGHPSQFFYTRLTQELDPEPYTPDHYLRRYPYANYQRVLRRLQESADAGLLTRESGDRFRVTEAGRHAVNTTNEHFYRALNELDLIPEEQLTRLVSLLERVVQAALDAEILPKDGLTMSHNGPPPSEYPMARIDQLLDDLTAFREDMHIAAWTSYEVKARDWEALTLVWRDEARSPEALAEKLPFQGYTVGDYERSAQRLAQRGWLKNAASELRLTEEGAAVREEAEARTNDYFARALATLEDDDQTELRTLLIRLKGALQRSHIPALATVV